VYATETVPTEPISTTENFDYTFFTGGNFTINLTITKGMLSSTALGYVDIYNQTGGDFAANVTSGMPPLPVQFVATTYNTTSWNWTLGDGNVSALQNPEHTYEMSGTYDVKLYINNTAHGTWINKTGYISVYCANFTGTPTSGSLPLLVSFTDLTTGSPTAWNWSFGDGTYSELQNPTHSYTTIGTYTVTLTSTIMGIDCSKTRTGYILAGYEAIPDVSFSANITEGASPFAVQFTDLSTQNPTAWNWSFGGDGYSDEQNPVHTFTTPGSYFVNLTATNPIGSGALNRSAYITVLAEGTTVVDFSGSPTSGSPGVLVQFADLSIVTNTTDLAYNWSFGDGTYSDVIGNVQHVYSYTSVYDVKLTIANAVSTEYENKLQYITVATDQKTQTTFYTPQQVRFRFVGIDGYPLSGMEVTATPINFTAPSNWPEILFGIDPNVNITGTAVSGITGDDGSWSAPVLSSIQYSIHMLRSDIDYTITLYPSQTEYPFTIPIGVIAIPTPASNVVSYSIQNASVDATHQYINMSYLDASGGTNTLNFSVHNTSNVVLASASYSGAAANNQVFSQLITVSQGESYTFAFAANQSEYGWINQTDTVTLANQIGLLDAAPGWVEEWIAIALIIIIASIFTLWSKPFALVGIPIAGWFFQHILGWLPSTFMSDIAFVCMLALGILVYIRQKENAIQ
jgi:PKD repeat protein